MIGSFTVRKLWLGASLLAVFAATGVQATERRDVGRVYDISPGVALFRTTASADAPRDAPIRLELGSLVYSGDEVELRDCGTAGGAASILTADKSLNLNCSSDEARRGRIDAPLPTLHRVYEVFTSFKSLFSRSSFRMPAASRAVGATERMRCSRPIDARMEDIRNSRQILLAGLQHIFVPDSLVNRPSNSTLSAANGTRIAVDTASRTAPYFRLPSPLDRGYYRVRIETTGGLDREWIYEAVAELPEDVPASVLAGATSREDRAALAAVWLASRDIRYYTLAYSLLADQASVNYLADEMRIRLKSLVCLD